LLVKDYRLQQPARSRLAEEGCRVNDQERFSLALIIKQDYEKVSDSINHLKQVISIYALALSELSEQIPKQISFQTWDRETMKADVDRFCDNVARYQKLLVEQADLRSRLEPYKDLFKPLD